MDLSALLIGAFAAFVIEFLRYTKVDLGQPKSVQKIRIVAGKPIRVKGINVWAVISSALFVLIGGVVAMILGPINLVQAMAFGAGWQGLFINVVGMNPG